MSSAQIVRKPLHVNEGAARTLDIRLSARFPLIARMTFGLIGRLPPRSRLRQALLWRAVRLGVEAFNRRDLDVVVMGYQADLEYYPYREFVDAALAEPCYHGPSGYRRYVDDTQDAWGTEVLLMPTELIDLGERFVLLAEMPMRARASGIELDQTYAGVSTLKNGLVIRQHDYLNHAEALAAVGLSDDPSR